MLTLVNSIRRMAGPKITLMFLATVPNGLLLGGVEVVIAFAFYLVLARFQLVALTDVPTWVPNFLNPIVLLIVVMLAATVLRYTGQALPSLANSAFNARLRESLAHAVLNRPGEGGIFSVAEVSHLSESVASKAGGFMQGLASSVSTLSLLLLISTQLFALSWKLTALSFVGAAVLGFPIMLLKPICGRFSDRQYKLMQAFTYRFLKDVRNVYFLKVCGLSASEADQLGQLARVTHANSRTYTLLNGFIINLPSLAGAFLILGLLWINESYSIMAAAGLVPFIYLLNRAIGSLVTLSLSHGLTRECLPHVVELAQYTNILFPDESKTEHGGVAAPPLVTLQVHQLSFGRVSALTPPLSFDVCRGQMVLISGTSGRGKTTLLMTFLGLIPAIGGSIKWSGVSLDDIDPIDLRRKIGFAGPEPYLIDADIKTNLLFGLDRTNVSEAEIGQALCTVCAEFVFDLEGGLSHVLREHGDGISAGQKQRLALARCLLRLPEVLFLDEATANIDEETEKEIFGRLLKNHPELMIIAVSHRSSLKSFATQIIEI